MPAGPPACSAAGPPAHRSPQPRYDPELLQLLDAPGNTWGPTAPTNRRRRPWGPLVALSGVMFIAMVMTLGTIAPPGAILQGQGDSSNGPAGEGRPQPWGPGDRRSGLATTSPGTDDPAGDGDLAEWEVLDRLVAEAEDQQPHDPDAPFRRADVPPRVRRSQAAAINRQGRPLLDRAMAPTPDASLRTAQAEDERKWLPVVESRPRRPLPAGWEVEGAGEAAGGGQRGVLAGPAATEDSLYTRPRSAGGSPQAPDAAVHPPAPILPPATDPMEADPLPPDSVAGEVDRRPLSAPAILTATEQQGDPLPPPRTPAAPAPAGRAGSPSREAGARPGAEDGVRKVALEWQRPSAGGAAVKAGVWTPQTLPSDADMYEDDSEPEATVSEEADGEGAETPTAAPLAGLPTQGEADQDLPPSSISLTPTPETPQGVPFVTFEESVRQMHDRAWQEADQAWHRFLGGVAYAQQNAAPMAYRGLRHALREAEKAGQAAATAWEDFRRKLMNEEDEGEPAGGTGAGKGWKPGIVEGPAPALPPPTKPAPAPRRSPRRPPPPGPDVWDAVNDAVYSVNAGVLRAVRKAQDTASAWSAKAFRPWGANPDRDDTAEPSTPAPGPYRATP